MDEIDSLFKQSNALEPMSLDKKNKKNKGQATEPEVASPAVPDHSIAEDKNLEAVMDAIAGVKRKKKKSKKSDDSKESSKKKKKSKKAKEEERKKRRKFEG